MSVLSFSSARRKELKEASTLSKPSPIWEGLIVEGQRPPFYKVLVWLTSLRPYGVSHGFLFRLRERGRGYRLTVIVYRLAFRGER